MKNDKEKKAAKKTTTLKESFLEGVVWFR